MRAIDLYSGIGGWSLGLKLAGVEVVSSFERWQVAIDTYNANLGTSASPIDIRGLDLKRLPKEIDLVVGSPPCTEFSFSNRGGNGDVMEGVKDLVRFLEIVRRVQPKFWIMENVPRVADVIRRGMRTKTHALYQFRDLCPNIEVMNLADFGLPQSRVRCIVGNFPLERLMTYRTVSSRLTLGDVIHALARTPILIDPTWNIELPRKSVTDMELEDSLDDEQLRMNREAKLYHPVYNNMAFPDQLAAPSRTVTATCTRVSRESIIVPDHRSRGSYRRLTLRERASLQGFPISYQLHSTNYSDKVKIIGNALPPPFAYLVAAAVQDVPANKLQPFSAIEGLKFTPKPGPVTLPNGRGLIFPSKRTFRAALPHLRFKSGMRFELGNQHRRNRVEWRVRFFFGPSTDIQSISLDSHLLSRLKRFRASKQICLDLDRITKNLCKLLASTSPDLLQRVWSHRDAGPGPFEICDLLGAIANQLRRSVKGGPEVEACVASIVGYDNASQTQGPRKIKQNAASILCGFVIGAWFNTRSWHDLTNTAPSTPRMKRKPKPKAA